MPDLPETPFAEAIKVVPDPRNSSLFNANIPLDWRGTPAAHGGYLQSLIFSTARTYFNTHHQSRNQPDPINSYLQFLKQVSVGPVRLVVTPISIGSRVSVIQIEIQTPLDSPSEAFKTCLLATVTQGNLATEKGITLPTIPILKAADVPDREKDCESYTYPEDLRKVAPGAFKVIERRARRGKQGFGRAQDENSVREMWFSFADGTGLDILSLGYLIDMFSGAPNSYVQNDVDYQSGVIYPTLSMATEIKRDPKGCKWLFQRVQSFEIRNGRFDTNVTVLNEEGELIATSKHVSLALGRNSPEELKRIYRL